MTDWQWILGGTPPSGVETRELSSAYGRTLTLRLDAPSTAQFSLNGASNEAAQIVSLATDLTIRRDGVLVFRGRITTEADDISETTNTVQFTAIDYRGMLAYRQVGAAGATFAAVDQGTIAYTLVSTSQALSGGNWGVTNGAGATSGTVRDRTYLPGKPLIDAITELGRVTNGFEWYISPLLALERYYPTRGSANGVILDYGGMVSKLRRVLAPGDFANSVMATGATGLAPATAVSGTVGSDVRGLWETSKSSGSVIEQSTLTEQASWLLAQTSTLRPELGVTLSPGRWGGLSIIGVGDTVTGSLNVGRLAVAGNYRVAEINAQPGENGTETVTLGLIAA